MNICFVTQEYPPETNWGGIGIYYSELANYLALSGQTIVVLSRSTNEAFTIKHEPSGVIVYRIPPYFNFGKKKFLWRIHKYWDGYQINVFLKLKKIVREHNIDIIEHPGLHGEPYFYQLLQANKPLIITRLHAAVQHEFSTTKGTKNIPVKISQFLERRSIKKSKGISSVSKASLEKNRYQIPDFVKVPVSIIPNPIDLSIFSKKQKEIPENLAYKPFLLFVGRLQVNKGAHILAKTLESIFTKYPELKMVFIGRDDNGPGGYPSMVKYIKEIIAPRWHNNLIFIGQIPRENIIAYYHHCQFVVFPSLWETFGYITLEAMAAGKPIIASRSGGPEEIIEEGKDGLLVPINDPEALEQAMLYLLRNPDVGRRMGEAGFKKVKEKYEISTVAKEVINFYLQVLSSHKNSEASKNDMFTK